LYVVLLDFKKAFDTVPRDLLLEGCEQFGVHSRFLALLKRLYADIKMQVVVNGHVGEPFCTAAGTMALMLWLNG
jgi:hypothetical protein